MTVDQSYSSECVVGYLQKKGRFYSWKRALFVLCEHGLIQLSTEPLQRGHPASAAQARIPAPNSVIGDANDVNFKVVSRLKQKQCIALHQLCQMVGQGQREIYITMLDSSTTVLRAQSAQDRDQWLAAIRSAVAAAAVAGYASAYPDCDDAPPLSPPVDYSAPKAVTPHLADLNLSTGSVGLSLTQENTDAQPSSPTGIYTAQQDSVNACLPNDDNPMGWLPSTTSLPHFDNELPPHSSSPQGRNISTALVSHFATSSQNNDSRDFEQSIAHIARDIGSIDVDALFEDGNSHRINRSTSSGELPLAVIATRTAELRRSKQAMGSSLLPNASDVQLPALSSYAGPSDIASSPGFDGMFDTLLYAQASGSPDNKNGTFVPDVSLSQLNLASSAAELPPGSVELAHSRVVMCEEPPTQALSPVSYPNTAEPARDLHSSKHCKPVPSSVPQQRAASPLKKKAAADVDGSMVLLNTSIADFAGALFDGIYLGNLSTADIEKTVKPPGPAEQKTPGHVEQSTGCLDQASPAVLDDPREENVASRLLNSPSRSQLDSHIRAVGRRSVMTIYGGLGVSAQQQKQNPPGPSGIQMSILAKYSDSLNASRTLLSSGLRANKGTATHAWGSRADFTGSALHAERPTSIVQYESKEPKDTGVRKVVLGQFAKDLIQKEAERRPAVRRMRQVKSETKVPPLKSIRLRLDGSIVGGTASNNANGSPSRAPASRGLHNTAKENKAAGASGQEDAITSSANKGNAQVGAFEEFNIIRERLKLAEEQKKLQQQAQMLDNEGVDNVRIGDLMQTRQDIPLAVQIEEKRRMQEAKRLALLSQQLEHQKRQMEIQRLNAEQQQQYQEFKRQSLCPTIGGASASAAAVAQPGYDNGAYGGTESYTNQWVQNSQNMHFASAMPSPHAQSMHLQSQAASRPVSNAGYRPVSYMSPMAPAGGAGGYMHDYSVAGMPYPDNPGMAYDPAYSWQQQHNYHLQGVNNASGRPASQFAPQPGGAQNPWPPANNRTASKRRQPGAAFVKHGRAASAGEKSERSNGTTESWQSNTGRGARSSVHANTEPAYEGSVYVISPVSNSVDADPSGTKRRAHSYGQAEHRRRLMAKRVSDVLARPRPANNGNNNVPPVPPLPQNIQQFQHYQHPPQQQQYYAPYPVAGGGVGGGGGGWSAQNQMYMGNQQRMYADVQSLTRKRNEMSTDTPSLLQQLDHARVLGVLPSRHQEKAAYTRGAYQNYNTSHLMTNGTRTNMQYLGDGNTLLIDQAYEAERSRNAILKKISHTYKGIGGESAPAPVF